MEPHPEFRIPPVNESIPRNFDLYPIDENVSFKTKGNATTQHIAPFIIILLTFQEPQSPYIFHNSSISEIWFKQDNKSPRLSGYIELFR